MKNNLLPSLVMLLAGLVCSIISLRQGVDLMSFTTRLLTVLVVFYIIGAILKVILSCAFKAMEDRQKKAEAAEAKTDDSEVRYPLCSRKRRLLQGIGTGTIQSS